MNCFDYVWLFCFSLVISDPSLMLLFELDSLKLSHGKLPLLGVEVELVHLVFEHSHGRNLVEVY